MLDMMARKPIDKELTLCVGVSEQAEIEKIQRLYLGLNRKIKKEGHNDN